MSYYLVAAVFTMGLCTDEEDHFIVWAACGLLWPLALGRYVKKHVEGKR